MSYVTFLEVREDDILVGAKDPDTGYVGPVARVSADKDWLWVITDDYEGTAMLNIEALPKLIEALQLLQSQRAHDPLSPP